MLRDKVILVVGGTSGIGLSAAVACLAEGASVSILGRRREELAEAVEAIESNAAMKHAKGLESRIECCMGDATSSLQVDDAFAQTIERFGGLDGVVHVAGASGRRHGDGPLHEVTDEGWEWTLRTNLDSVAWSNRAATRYWLEEDRNGSIVNIGSVIAANPSPHFFATHAYATAKAGIEGLSRAAASRYAANNIRFNVIAPGLIDSPMAQRAMHDEEIQDYLKTKQPLDSGRAGVPSDLDGAIVFLLSDSSAWVTGQVIDVDGGWSVSEGQIP